MCTFSCRFVFFHRDDEMVLKSPRIIVTKELMKQFCLSKFDRESSNLTLPWLGDLYTTSIYPLKFLRETSQMKH